LNITFELNGNQVEWDVAPGETLLEALRTNGQFSLQDDCENGTCEMCSVLVGGIPVNSCVVAAVRVHGSEITTLAGFKNQGDVVEVATHLDSSPKNSGGIGLPEALKQGYAAIGWDQKQSATESYLRRGLGKALAGEEQSNQELPSLMAAQFADVEVDFETGELLVRKLVSVMECSADSGSFTVEEKETESGPFDEAFPAVFNAIYDAVEVRISKFPVTGESLWRALVEKEENEG